jgi:uncharacterized DUF497 family protein
VEEVELKWTQNTVDHIQRHGVMPEEVEEVIYEGKPFVKRGPGSGRNRRYYVLGQTQAGRYLQIGLGRVGGTTFKVITARNMEDDERRLYKKRSA